MKHRVVIRNTEYDMFVEGHTFPNFNAARAALALKLQQYGQDSYIDDWFLSRTSAFEFQGDENYLFSIFAV